jgi:hypothetical protein
MLSVDRILLFVTVAGLLACAVAWLLCEHCACQALGRARQGNECGSATLQPAGSLKPGVYAGRGRAL